MAEPPASNSVLEVLIRYYLTSIALILPYPFISPSSETVGAFLFG